MPGPTISALRPRARCQIRLAELFGASAEGAPADGASADGNPAVGDTLVSGITLDSRLVRPGDVYVALPGSRHHGAQFAAEAAGAGAAAILTDPAGGRLAASVTVPVVVVAEPRRTMAEVAAAIFDQPATSMTMHAVTGTNGKTTTTYLLEAALRATGVRTGLIGTIGFRLDGKPLDAARTTVTTPESPELQAMLAYLREVGAGAVLMEVSSHALVLGRADAIVFDVAAFTNLGRDHLDFHGSEEAYFAAKASLFTPERTRHAVVNVDDPRGAELAERIRATAAVGLTTVSLTGPADVYATAYAEGPDGRTMVQARLGDRTLGFDLLLPGEFNIRNALTALAMVAVTGGDVDSASTGLAGAGVPGRMERVDLGPGAPLVYVDFAHTPQAVAAALDAVRGRRRIAVLGCGGDRDPHKRGPMGEAAARHADVVVVTDDNPRSEDPTLIRDRIIAGASAAIRADGLSTRVVDGGDRRAAIRTALQLAAPGDVVTILGKGHETGQQVGSVLRPFLDSDVVVEEWAGRS